MSKTVSRRSIVKSPLVIENDQRNGSAPTEGVDGSYPRITIANPNSQIEQFRTQGARGYSLRLGPLKSSQIVVNGSAGHPDAIQRSAGGYTPV